MDPHATKLRVGAAREIITPPVGSLLMGYSPRPGETVHDDLAVTAVALAYGEVRALLLAVDVCLVNNALCARLRALAGAAAGVPPEHVIVSASHTHSGPHTEELRGRYAMDAPYCEGILLPRCAAAASAAAAALRPARMGVASVECHVGVNRRQLLPDDTVKLGQNPWAPHDPAMTLLSFVGADGAPLVSLVHYGAHCTAAGIGREITRDWAGVMLDRLEQVSGAPAAYLSGTGGDVAPRMANGRSAGTDLSCAMEVGAIAAADAVRAFRSVRATYDEPCAAATGEIRLPCAPLMPPDEARAALERLDGKPGMQASALAEILELHRRGGAGEDAFTFRQTLLRIGPVVLVPFPFETFSEIGLRLRAYACFGHVLTLGCANGSNSYLPTRDQMARGGYEVESFRWARPRRLPEDTDTRLIHQNLQLMERL